MKTTTESREKKQPVTFKRRSRVNVGNKRKTCCGCNSRTPLIICHVEQKFGICKECAIKALRIFAANDREARKFLLENGYA